MNKKFLTKLLMGALFIASVSVFTSCKDYDDDIKGLETRVGDLEKSLNEQIAALNAVQAECKANCEATATRVAAAEAALKAKADQDAVDKAIAAAIAGYQADDVKYLAEAKEYAAAQAADAAAKAQAAAIEEAKKLAEDLKAQIATKVGTEDFNKAVAELTQKIEAVDPKLNKLTEDFDALKSAVDANGIAVNEIKTQIAALETFKAEVEKDFPGVKADVATALEKLAAQEKALADQKADLQKAIDAAKDDFAKQLAALEEKISSSETVTALASRVSTLESQILVVNGSIETLTNSTTENANAIAEIKTAMEEAQKAVEELGDAVKAIDNLSLFLEKFVTSIVLKPEFFYGGIEAIELPALYDYAWNEPTQPLTLQETFTLATDKAMIDVSKGGTAYYHINPWKANLDGKIKFISNIATSRAGEADADITLITPVDENLTNDNWSKVYPGVVAVDFVGSFQDINSLLKAGKLPQVALNYQQTTDEKTINVSSDWALVAPTQYSDLVIADITWANHKDDIETPASGHLTQRLVELAADSIPATHAVLYNGKINLDSLVETHYSYSYRDAAGVEVKSEDKTLDAATFEKFGLQYEYALVSYTLGDNKTDESVHVVLEQDKETGDTYARPVKVTADGKRALDEDGNAVQADKASLDRMPIVRIILRNKDTKQIAAYAYMKLIISETIADEPKTPEVVVPFESSTPFYVDCDSAAYEYTLTWSQVEALIISDALNGNYSKKQFEENWELVGTDDKIANVESGAEATQFAEQDEAKLLTPTIGVVSLLKDDENAHTSVLKWVVDSATIANLDYDATTGLNTKDLNVYVLFKGVKNVWVKLTIKAGTFRKAVGTINDNKTLAYWFDLNTKGQGIAADPAHQNKETRANVTVPNTQNDDCAFEWDILSAFDGYTVGAKINNEAQYPKFKEGMTCSFTFTTPSTAAPKKNAEFDAAANGTWTVPGNSGATYTVQVSSDFLSVEAVSATNLPKELADSITFPATIVKLIAAEDAEVASVLQYQENAAAFDILNYAGHNEVASKQTFTAYLKVDVESCYPLIIADGSDYFNVKFLRPVDVEKTNNAVVEDAVDAGSIVNVMDLVSLVDWRDQKFTSANGITDNDGSQEDVTYVTYDTPHYINYYGVEIAADVDNAVTDINKSAADREKVLTDVAAIEKLVNLKENSPKCTFTFTPAPITYDTKAKKLVGGEIFYANNSGNVEVFHIYVPLTISYKWGQNIKCGYGVITVKKTLSQAKKF